MDKRQMMLVKDQGPRMVYCSKCGIVHEFKYSHLKLDRGKKYSVFVGVGCYIEHLEEISE